MKVQRVESYNNTIMCNISEFICLTSITCVLKFIRCVYSHYVCKSLDKDRNAYIYFQTDSV